MTNERIAELRGMIERESIYEGSGELTEALDAIESLRAALRALDAADRKTDAQALAKAWAAARALL